MNYSHYAVRERVSALPRDKRSQEWWHPSSLGQCLVGSYLKRIGAEQDEPTPGDSVEHMETGKGIEEGIVKVYKRLAEAEGVDADTQRELTNEEYNVKGKPDLILTQNDSIFDVKEVKAINCRSYQYKAKAGQIAQENHALQLGSYLWMLGLPLGFEGHIVYRKMCWPDVIEVPVVLTEELLGKITMEFEILNRALKGTLPPPLPEPVVLEETYVFNRYSKVTETRTAWKVNWRAGYCKYHKQCSGPTWREEAEALAVEKNKELTEEKDVRQIDSTTSEGSPGV